LIVLANMLMILILIVQVVLTSKVTSIILEFVRLFTLMVNIVNMIQQISNV